jgi:hypothetical protein
LLNDFNNRIDFGQIRGNREQNRDLAVLVGDIESTALARKSPRSFPAPSK